MRPLEPTTVWLDPEAPPAELALASVASRLLPETALLHGHVVDERTFAPLANVIVRLEGASLTTQTDERGYFSLNAPGARRIDSPDVLPPSDDLVLEAPGYKRYRLAHVALLETDIHFIVDMELGTGETIRDEAHKLFRPSEPSAQDSGREPEPPIDSAFAVPEPALPFALVVDPPDSINVQGFGYMSLETYVGNGLDSEWLTGWSADALRAGAIAYRSYGAWYQINRGYICATTSCQVYNSTSYASTRQAAQFTSGIMLQKGGLVARSEYSAENNCSRCGNWSCANNDTSCGHGAAGSPAAGWPCLTDFHSFGGYTGSCCFGHGRGMCQWGTHDWGLAGKSWAWMVNHYYNDEGAGTGQRTMFMTSPVTVVAITSASAASASNASIANLVSIPAGSSFSVSATGRNYAEHVHAQLLMRTRLTGGAGSVANGAGDGRITLNPQTDTQFSVTFAIPANAAAGTYDLTGELWFDVNNSGAVDDGDLSLAAVTLPSAVTITGGTGGCSASVPADNWKGEYWPNMDLSGTPSLVRADGTGALNFDWGGGGPNACGIGVDNFSARWTRTVNFTAGTYRFTATSDDGFRLYVDGTLQLDKWIIQGPTAYVVDLTLSAGNHTLRMDWFENGGGAVAKLSWEPIANDPCTATVAPDLWKGEYWSNTNLSGPPSMVRNDWGGSLDFDWGTGGPNTCGVGVDTFSARWTRSVNFRGTTYRFFVTADDGFRLYLDNTLLLDKWIIQGPTTYTVDVPVSAGRHTLRMDWFEQSGLAVAKLSWGPLINPCTSPVVPDGWLGEYWSNKDLSGSPATVRDDAAVNFNWGDMSPEPTCGIGADNFSARWTRTLNFAAGTYRFSTRTDDGVRLYIDNVLKVDRWIDRGPTPDTVDVTLGAGNHTVRMEYYENGGGALAELSWAPVGDSCTATVPADHWKGEYFNNMTLSGSPSLVRDDGTGEINSNWEYGSPNPGTPCTIQAEQFSARWTRVVNFTAGSYRFTTRTDDGVRFYVDDVLKIDKWIDRGATPDSVDVTLGAGNHTLRMEYYENGGAASAALSWAPVSPPNPTEFLCDDGDPCFELIGPPQYWNLETCGHGSDMYWTYVNGNVLSNAARFKPTLAAGNYEVRVFVPRCHATSRQARYAIFHNGVTEWRSVDQNAVFDDWVSLGSFAFAGNGSEYVEVQDATGESGSLKVGADAVKFVPGGTPPPPPPPPPPGGWSFPVGSADSGAGWRVTLGLGQSWQDNSGYWYRGHLAEDWGRVGGSALGQPVYAAAAGEVVTVRQNCGNYVDVVIIKHQVAGMPEPIYSFYGHIEADGYVSVGDRVARRQQIGVIGDPVTFGPHLHFEIKNHTALVNRPFSSCSNTPAGVYISAGYSGESGQYGGGAYYDPTNDGVVGNYYYHPTSFVSQRSGAAAPMAALSAPPAEPTWEDGLPRCGEHP